MKKTFEICNTIQIIIYNVWYIIYNIQGISVNKPEKYIQRKVRDFIEINKLKRQRVIDIPTM